MGLDISHLQLTMTPNENGDFFSIDDWDLDCNVSIEHYSKYIRTINDLDFNKTIAIVPNETQYEKIRKTESFSGIDYIKVFVGEMNDSLHEQISKYIVNHKLDKLEISQLGCEHDGVKYQTISFGEPIKIQGVYYIKGIGYQRKGMSKLFYENFNKYFLWGRKEDFEMAYTCVADEWHLENWGQGAVDRMKLNFKENFIDKYEFGKSLLCASF